MSGRHKAEADTQSHVQSDVHIPTPTPRDGVVDYPHIDTPDQAAMRQMIETNPRVTSVPPAPEPEGVTPASVASVPDTSLAAAPDAQKSAR